MGQMLGMMEGMTIDTSAGAETMEHLQIDTTNILFICSGSFEGLEEIVRKDPDRREEMRRKMGGFGMLPFKGDTIRMASDSVKIRHLIRYGLKPELAGRLCNLAVLDGMDREMLKHILTDCEDNTLRQLQREMMLDDEIELRFSEKALDVIVDKALSRGTGARALNAICREALVDVMFDYPSLPSGTVITVEPGMMKI